MRPPKHTPEVPIAAPSGRVYAYQSTAWRMMVDASIVYYVRRRYLCGQFWHQMAHSPPYKHRAGDLAARGKVMAELERSLTTSPWDEHHRAQPTCVGGCR